ncbi:hypothetical protein HPB49_005346 [Dermacentor silvarum]|uniref:Uncharacterized protein n=1 Tax=Dermacentor silvarum TaxID=543639 RepID=A0ACB8DN06_DERSI|nr:hypothetical protein HPB49_005346 [Dermacentor silvarum]
MSSLTSRDPWCASSAMGWAISEMCALRRMQCALDVVPSMRNSLSHGHLAINASCTQRKLFAKHAKTAQGHQSRSATQTGKNGKSSSQSNYLSKGRSGSPFSGALRFSNLWCSEDFEENVSFHSVVRRRDRKELEQIYDMKTEVSTRDFENTWSHLQKQLSEIQRSIDTARTRFKQQLKERNEQKLVLQHRLAEWKEEIMFIDQAKRRQSLSPRRGSAPPPKHTRPHPKNGGKLKNPPHEPSKEETGRSVEVVPQAYHAPEYVTQCLNDTRAQVMQQQAQAHRQVLQTEQALKQWHQMQQAQQDMMQQFMQTLQTQQDQMMAILSHHGELTKQQWSQCSA